MIKKVIAASPGGILLVNKPPGLTSFDIIRKLKKQLGIRKIGHTGTLDKFAGGLLILVLGKYTRLASLFLDQNKEYIAEIKFGSTTDTLDPEGEITGEGIVPGLETIRSVLADFQGEIDQVPPVYSAVHVNGKRAYQLTRQGQPPVLKSRRITIYALNIINYTPPLLAVRVKCSKGTYIRSLARDLGAAAGTCAYVVNLTRTCIGGFRLNDAPGPEQVTPGVRIYQPAEIIDSINGISRLTINPRYLQKILTGNVPDDNFFTIPPDQDGICFVFDLQDELLAVVRRRNNRYQFLSVLGKRGS